MIIVNDIIKLIALSSVSAGQIKMLENRKCRLLVNKKNPERPRNPSLVTFDTNQFLRESFQLKLAFGKFGRIFLILRGCRSPSTLIEAKHLF